MEARIKLNAPLDCNWFFGLRLTIDLSQDGYASTIRIEGKVDECDMIAMTVENTPAGVPHFNLSGGFQIQRTLVEELKVVESTLGLFCKLSRIRWEYATFIAIPETPEEERTVQWNRLRVTEPDEDTEVSYSSGNLWTLLQLGHFARDLSVTIAFFREGAGDLRSRRYISAYFSFYFVIEGLYANGQFGGKEVRAEFGKSKILMSSINEVLSFPLYSSSGDAQAALSLEDLLSIVKKPRTALGVIHLLVWLRGDLHHFVNRPKKMTGSPFTHARYRIAALLIHDICVSALREEVLSRFPRDDDQRRRRPENQVSMRYTPHGG